MIREAMEYVKGLATKAATPHELPGGPREHRFVLDGEVVAYEAPATPRQHSAATLEELISLANRFGGVVWYDEKNVVLVIDDDAHRIERATLALEQSDVFKRAVRLRDEKTWFEQKPFVRLLRIELARTLPAGTLLDRVRKVRFDNGVTTSGEVQRNRESLGREITSKVEAGGEIPEEVTLDVPVFKTPGERDPRSIRCAVEVDPGCGTFQLLPFPDEIERVLNVAVSSIGDRLGEGLKAEVPHYYGRP